MLTERLKACAVSAAANEQVIGSAAQFSHLLALEVPAPWPREALQAEHLPAPIRAALTQAVINQPGLRVQALLPHPTPPPLPHAVRVLYFWLPPGQQAPFSMREFALPVAEIPALITTLTTPNGDVTPFSDFEQPSLTQRELLVCTHGSRDVCCGTFGFPIYQWLQTTSITRQDFRVWRTSHIGGHRFAPTLLDMPSGRTYGRLTAAHLPRLLDAPDDPSLQPNYRGHSALPPLAQVAELAYWRHFGGLGLAQQRQTTILEMNKLAGTATISIRSTNQPTVTIQVQPHGTLETLKSSGSPKLETVQQYSAEVVAMG